MRATTNSLHSLDDSTSSDLPDPYAFVFILSFFLVFGIVRYLKKTPTERREFPPPKKWTSPFPKVRS
jgi:hypothetical protein